MSLSNLVFMIALTQPSLTSKTFSLEWSWLQTQTLIATSDKTSAVKSGNCSLQAKKVSTESQSEASRCSYSVFAASTYKHCLKSQSSNQRRQHQHRNRSRLTSLHLRQSNIYHRWGRSSMKWYCTNWQAQKVKIKPTKIQRICLKKEIQFIKI